MVYSVTCRWMPGRFHGVAMLVCVIAMLSAHDSVSLASPATTPSIESIRVGLASRNAARRVKALNQLEARIVAQEQRTSAGDDANQRDAQRLVSLRAGLRSLLNHEADSENEAGRVASLLPRIQATWAWKEWSALLGTPNDASPLVLQRAIVATTSRSNDTGFLRFLVERVYDRKLPLTHRAFLLEALGTHASALALAELSRHRPKAHWLIQASCSRGLGYRRDFRRVPPLLRMLKSSHRAVQVQAWESLVRVTRQPLKFDVKIWDSWWETYQASMRKTPSGRKGAGERSRYAIDAPPHIPHYYGIPIPRRKSGVVFCLDVSQSMYGFGIAAARRELRKSLLDFPSTHRFQIIGFHQRVLPWRDTLSPAHPVQKYLALKWADALETIAYTNIYDAVELAFGYAGRGRKAVARPVRVDEIFLLSDGAPNRGAYRASRLIVKHLKALAQPEDKRAIPIHTVAAGESVYELLDDLATATGGTFVDAYE